MINWILGGLIIGAMILAAYYSLRKARKGECVGCSGCGSHEDHDQVGGSCCCCNAPTEKSESIE